MTNVAARLRPYIRISAIIIAISIVAGMMGMLLFPEQVNALMRPIFVVLRDLGQEIMDEQPPLQGTFTLFLHNWRVVILMVVLGAFLGVYPVLAMIMNGALLGAVVGLSVAGEFPLIMLIAGILPHGIIEIPALVIGAGGGIYLGTSLLAKRSWPDYKQSALDALWTILFCAPLLLVAAAIEVNITPLVMQFFQ